MKVGWFLSMQIPSVPQRIDFKTYLGFTDGVVRADGLCIGCHRLVGRRKAANSNMLEFFCTTL